MPEFELRHNPSYSLLDARLAEQEEFLAEAGAMVSMDAQVDTSTERPVGLFSSLLRKVFGGESIYLARYEGPGRVQLAPTMVGDVKHLDLQNEDLLMQAGAFMAASSGVAFYSSELKELLQEFQGVDPELAYSVLSIVILAIAISGGWGAFTLFVLLSDPYQTEVYTRSPG